jgi:hypothetical protein
MRRFVFAIALLVPGAQAAGQAPDPDVRAAGTGVLPAGWTLRLDSPAADPTAASFTSMAPGWHVTTGPAAIFYRSADVATGEYVVNAVMHQTKAPAHPEAYGIFLGGLDLETPSQAYLYFLVRGDGKFMVKHRQGADLHRIVDWTDDPAIAKQDAAGTATNALTVRVDADSVRFLVNAKPVQAFPRTIMKVVDGQAGVRVNHNLDVHISRFDVVRGSGR